VMQARGIVLGVVACVLISAAPAAATLGPSPTIQQPSSTHHRSAIKRAQTPYQVGVEHLIQKATSSGCESASCVRDPLSFHTAASATDCDIPGVPINAICTSTLTHDSEPASPTPPPRPVHGWYVVYHQQVLRAVKLSGPLPRLDTAPHHIRWRG
jgi:hypothetical protein